MAVCPPSMFFKESRVISQQTEFKQTKGNSLGFLTALKPL